MNNVKTFVWVLVIFLFVVALGSCQKKEPVPPIKETADLEIELKISGYCWVGYHVTKGEEPNIYRDGVLVSQGDYRGGGDRIQYSERTSFRHHGRKLKVTVGLSSRFYSANPTVQATLYRDGVIVSRFSKTYELNPRRNGVSVDFEVWAKE